MLIIQVPGIIAAGTWLFWDFGLRTHDIGFGSAITGAYLLFAVGFMILMQMQWRKQARRQAMAASMAEASSE